MEAHTNYEEGERIPFHFCDDGYVNLEAIPSEYKGWTLKPEDEETPLIVSMGCILFSNLIIKYLIGASLSEPHTSRVNEILSIYIYIYIYRYDFLPLKLL